MITVNDIRAAARRIEGAINRTPLLEYGALNRRARGRVLLKAEIFQETGSFKMRGAYNRISQLSAAERARGVVAWSSGNHAQGVARAAQLVGAPATILMPEDTPKAKVDGTRGFGAEVVFYNRYTDDREAMGRALAAERGGTAVPPFDDPHVIAGQGTVGLEIVEQTSALGMQVDQLLVCAGGGGLTAGCALALHDTWPQAEVFAVEPEGYDDIALSLAKGERVGVDPSRKSIADALLPPMCGEHNWAVMKTHVKAGLVVSEDEIREAVRTAFFDLKLRVEPGGAAALAAVLAGKVQAEGKVTAVTLSGGNVDPATFCEIIKS